jgi:hypothetical protein
MTPGSEVSFISLHGFRDSREMDRFFNLIKTRAYDYGGVSKVYTFSPSNMLRCDPKELFKLILDDKPIVFPMFDKEEKRMKKK